MKISFCDISTRNIWIIIGILICLPFIHKAFAHIREVPRGDLVIFFATLGIIMHIKAIAGYIYDQVYYIE